MIFDKLADGIVKHSKVILAIWVVVLICAVPLALKSGDVMNYDVNDMADSDSESMQGFQVIQEYFPSSGSDVSSMPILVIHYKDGVGEQQAWAFVDYLNAHYLEYVTDDGTPKLGSEAGTAFIGMPSDSKEDGSGILMVGVMYSGAVENISDDTPFLRDFINDMHAAFVEETGSDAYLAMYLTGTPAIGYDTMTGAMSDLQRIDPFTILLILVLVGLFFRSFITSATPPITIGFAFVVVLALIFGLGQVFNIFFITEMMLLVSMMGAGCDYCIFIIARYREELRSGKDHEHALHEAVKWAGESIAISGASVIIGFGAMSICSFSMVSTMGICLALGILVALLAALTLIPSILAIVGDRIFWPSKMDSFKEGGKSTKGWYAWFGRRGASYFEKSSRFSLKHAKAILVVSVLVTVPAAYVALTSETSYDMTGAMQTGDSGAGMDLIGEYANEGMLMPDYVILQYDEPIATIVSGGMMGNMLVWNEKWLAGNGLESLYSDILGEGNVASVVGPYIWSNVVAEAVQAVGNNPVDIVDYAIYHAGTLSQYLQAVKDMIMKQGLDEATASGIMVMNPGLVDYVVNCEGGIIGGDYVKSADGTGSASFVRISVSTYDSAMSPRSMETIDAVGGFVNSYIERMNADSEYITAKWVTGSAVVMFEVSNIISSEFNNIELLVIVLIIILLFVVMRSYTIPFRSVLTILMSICWTLAATHLVFVNILGGEAMWLIPMILLVICLGLGMDYDILLTTRIKENVKSRGLSNDEAIHQAVTHTGSVITICGLIMGGAFGTLMLSSMEMMQEFGFALCFAILVDALLVRTYIVPAVMHLLGDWNWKGPKFMEPKDKGTE